MRSLKYEKGLVDFASNDYLGLARSPWIPAFCSESLAKLDRQALNGFGSTGSRLMTGNHPEIERVEGVIAGTLRSQAALIFSSGYMANIGVLSAILEEGDQVFYDSFCHASILDGIRLSRADAFPFRHQDLCHLEMRLKRRTSKKHVYIVTESIFSTDGSLSPLKEIDRLALKYEAQLIVDDSHGIGIFWNEGKGLLFGLKSCVAGTAGCGKALGVMGGVALTSIETKKFLLNFGKTAIYSTALPLISIYALEGAFLRLALAGKEREKLFSLIQLFKKLKGSTSDSQIQPVFIEGNSSALKAAAALQEKGFLVKALLSPTVQKKSECLRITLHSFNKEEEVKSVLELLQ